MAILGTGISAGDDRPRKPDYRRRHFLGQAAMALVAARFGLVGRLRAEALAEEGTSEANQREPRQIAALRGAKEWVNSPLSATTLLGKVVIVQFGTYTCINWLRTLPYVRAWNQKYRPELVVIGVHTPEFSFEKKLENVRRTVERMKLDFPIAVDSDSSIWRAFNNQYWPALYFIDARGRLRDQHFGEGSNERSEQTIRTLLAETGVTGTEKNVAPIVESGFEVQADWSTLKSPEMYVGHARAQNFSSPGGAALGRQRIYAAPTRLRLNVWALTGEWTMANESAILNKTPGRIMCRFHARDVHLVMGPLHPEKPVRFRVSIDGQRPGSAHGSDVDDNGSGTVAEQRLYQLIRQPGPIADRTVEIEFLDAEVEAFAFTFG